MAVPKSKISKSRRGQRRAHKKVAQVNVVEDKTSGEFKRPHHVSRDGYYNGRKVTDETVAA